MENKKILVIKLGALGDVVRTLAIMPALKKQFPNSHITWITKKEAKNILEDNIYIDKVKDASEKIKEKFNILYNFDVEPEATKLAEEIQADKKYGFYSQEGFPSAFNIMAEYYLNTLFDDNLKKSNRKTYQEMMFDVAELKWEKQHCPIFLNDLDKKYAENFIKKNSLENKKLVGIHMGASSRWPSKVWHKEELKKFIVSLVKEGYKIILFGGSNEIKNHEKLVSEIRSMGINICQNNPKNTIKEFASLVDICDIIVCADSLALHVSLALKKPTIGLFFCTSPWEVEDYNLLVKITAPAILDFFPERMNEYSEELTKSIKAEQVLNEVKKLLA